MKRCCFESRLFPRTPLTVLLLVCLALSLQTAVAQDGSMKWMFDTGSGVSSSPAIGDEGIIFVGSNNGELYAVQPDGTEKWSYDTGSAIRRTPAIADDGTIYLVNNDGDLIALNPGGTLKWTFVSGVSNGGDGPIAIAEDGTIYAGIGTNNDTNGPNLFGINPDGTEFWTFAHDAGISGVSIGLDGLVLFGDAGGTLTALNSLGVKQWDIDIGPGISNAPSFAEDGTIYVASASLANGIAALNTDGTIKWQVTAGRVRGTLSTGVNGDIYVPVADGAGDGALVALDPSDGSEKWRRSVGGRVYTSPAVGFDGTIYIGSDTDQLIAVNPNGSQKWVFDADDNVQSSPTIAPNGTVYFGSSGGKVYAVNSSSAGLSASSWSKLQGDVRNTGRFGSQVTRKLWFAPHVFWVDDFNNAVVTIVHTGGVAGNPVGTTASFTVRVLNRDGTAAFSIDGSVEPGETKHIVLSSPGMAIYQGAAIVDASIKDGIYLAPFLTWNLDVSTKLEPLRIGAFFSNPTEAAQVHHFPAEASTSNGLGIAALNIGENAIECAMEFVNADGSAEGNIDFSLDPRGSNVGFFNNAVSEGFEGSAALSCDSPVVAVAVNQDFSNGGFPTDRLTIKGGQ